MHKATCTKCGATKSSSEFSPDRAKKSGLKSWCKECNAALSRARYLRKREPIMEYNREWAQRNPEKVREFKRRWDEKNPDRGQRADQEMARRRRTRWAKKNGIALAEKQQRRRARVVGATVISITTDQIAQRFAMWGGACWMCGGEADSIDHVKPIAAGGAHMLCNLRPACRRCNSAKGARWPFPSSSRGAPAALIENSRGSG